MADSERTKVLKALKTRLAAGYDAKTGTREKLLRGLRIGPLSFWEPAPCTTICDNGKRASSEDPGNDESEGFILEVRYFFHVAAEWKKESEFEAWLNRIEAIDLWLRGRPVGAGVREVNFVSSFATRAAFLSGQQQEVWVLDHEVEYFVHVDEKSDW
jgi:hypothetical protein